MATTLRGAALRADFFYVTSISLGGVDWDVTCCCDVNEVDPELGYGGPQALPTIDIWAIALRTWCGDRRIDMPPGVSVDLASLDPDEQARLQDQVLTAYVESRR